MKILYYSPHPHLNLSDPAGYGTHMREMIKAFRALGHEVELVIMGGTAPRVAAETPKPSLIKSIAKRFIPTRRWQTLKDKQLIEFDDDAYDQLLDRIKAYQPDFVYERGNYMQVSGVNAANRNGVMHFLELNSPYVEEKLELEGESNMLDEARKKEAWQLKKSDHVVVVSSSLKEYFMHEHHVFSGKISVIPNAIDPEKVNPGTDKIAAVKSKYGLEGKPVLGWVGSIQPWHGVETLIDAFAELAEKQTEIQLLIVGSGETIAEMQAKAGAKSCANRIHFTGYLPHQEVFAHIGAMDICILPNTKWYCSPIKIFEYGIMEKAIIASNHAAVLDVMDPGLDGLVIEPSQEALVEAMEKLVNDTDLREKIAQTFARKVKLEHTWEANARRVLDIYEFSQTSIGRS
jgi:glycosyltransferase involved in cell wall biosynthesis